MVRTCAAFTFMFGLAFALAGCGGEEGTEKGPPVEPPPPKFDYPLDDVLRFNHLQAKSTHNSFHIETDGNTVSDWRYTHAPLDVQLGEQGVRHVELDIRLNPDVAYFEVYHLPFLDEQTTCRKLTDCLRTLLDWSNAHRAHHPIVVQFEMRDTLTDEMSAEAYFESLHDEIRSVWPASRIITPDEIQGDAPTLRDAVLMNGWPTLGELRGRILFSLNDNGENRRFYTRDHTGLSGRLVFPQASPSDPWAAIAIQNDPVGDADAIASALTANMLVRTRADGDPGSVIEMGESVTKREAALASGAQFVTTDFPVKIDSTDYWVEIPGGTPSRCNPITAPAECTSEAVEDPKFVGP